MSVSIVTQLEFLLFNLIWIQIPGMMLDAILLRKRRFWATKLLSGYVLGAVTMILLYFLQGLIHTNLVVMIAGPVLSIGSVVFWFLHKKATLFSNGKRFRPEQLVIFAILFIFAVLAFQIKWGVAGNYSSVQINHDVLYHVGNIVTLSRGVPAVDLRVSGVDFYYHYLYDLIYGMCKSIFGMDAYTLYISAMPFMAAYPLGLALICLGDRCFDKRKHTDLERVAGRKVEFDFRYLFYIIGLLVCGICIYPINVIAEFFPLSWLNYHLFTNINSIGLAVAASVLFVDVIADNWKDEFYFRTLIVIFAYSFFATGAKGPTGAMLCVSVLLVAVVQGIIEKKLVLVRIWYFLAAFLGFVTCYVMIVAGFGGTGGNNREVTISPSGTILVSRVGNVFDKYLGVDPHQISVIWLVMLLITICLIGPSALSVFGWACIKLYRLVKEKYIGDIYDWFCICLTIIGIGGCLMVTIIGFSQGYMVLSSAPFIYYMILRYLQRGKSKLLKSVQVIAFILGAVILLGDAVFFVKEDMRNRGYTYATGEKAWVSQGELEGYRWIRDNTSEDSLICTDRRTEGIDTRNTFFYVSALAERQVYLEGHSYSDVTDEVVEHMVETNLRFYSSDPIAAQRSMTQHGINYMVVSNVTHRMYEPPCDELQLVYSNDDVRIYEFQL